MPMPISPDLLNMILVVLEVVLAVTGGFLAALWISLVIWTFRDIRSRSRDIFAQLLATLLVLIFGLPGLLLYTLLRPPERLSDAYERALEEEALLQDIEERLLCPGCKRQVKEDFILCPSCHTSLKKQCVSCNRILHLKWELCPYCGTDQTEEPPQVEEVKEMAPAYLEPAYAEPTYMTPYEKPIEKPAHEDGTLTSVETVEADEQAPLWFDSGDSDYEPDEDDFLEQEESETKQ